MIAFSVSCEAAIRGGTVHQLRDALNQKLQAYTSVYINPQEIGESGKLKMSLFNNCGVCTEQI